MTGRFLTVDFVTDPFDGRRVRVAVLGEVDGARIIEKADTRALQLQPSHAHMIRDALSDLSHASSLRRPDGLGPQFEVSEPRDLPASATDAHEWLRAQLAAAPRLDVQDVPQADDLDRVVNVVEARAHGRAFDDVSPRQWAYYRRAAKILGLIDEVTEEPTAAGTAIANARGTERTAALSERLRLSRVGAAWLAWSHVSSVDAIPPGLAAAFLADCVPTMSEATRKRRAATLERWRGDLSAGR